MLKIAPPRLPRRVKIEDLYAGMAELADAYGSGPYECKFMQVQVLLPAPKRPLSNDNGLFSTKFALRRVK